MSLFLYLGWYQYVLENCGIAKKEGKQIKKVLILVIVMTAILITNSVSVNAKSIEDQEVEEFIQALLPVMP